MNPHVQNFFQTINERLPHEELITVKDLLMQV